MIAPMAYKRTMAYLPAILAAVAIVTLVAGARSSPATRLDTGQSATSEPFGLSGSPVPEGPMRARWQTLETDISAELRVLATCRASAAQCDSAAALDFLAIIDAARTRQGRARIGGVNSAINLAVRWISDMAQHGVPEKWTSPLVTLATSRGDCMDFAITKYVALHEAGTPMRDLRIVIGWDTATREYHALAAARLDERWLMLDNRTMILVEDQALRNFVPIYALNGDGLRQLQRLPVAPDAGAQVSADARPCAGTG